MKNIPESLSRMFMPDDEKSRKKEREALEEKFKELAAIGGRCLANKDFILYREKFENARNYVIRYILELPKSDPIKYALDVSNATERLRAYEVLLNTVINDAKKGKKHGQELSNEQ